ncbi:MAG: SAM-dependent methyltransferase [Burkholderiaceae bacterium]
MTTMLQAAPADRRGRLYLVPAPLDFGCADSSPIEQSVPLGTLQIAARLTHWICENAKSTRAYLKRVDAVCPLALPLQSLNLQELPREVHKKGDHTGSAFDARSLLDPALAAHDIGLVSEAGMPAVADPGSSVVRAAHELKLDVVPLVGPSALLLALAASGLNGQQFAFAGYLPVESDARRRRIVELESIALKTAQAQLFIETPYRNGALWQALLQTLQPNTRLAFASGLTLADGHVASRLVSGWRAERHSATPGDLPTVFALGR